MKINNLSILLTTAALVSLTACASDPRLSPDGHAGYVTEFYSSERLHIDPPRCLKKLTPAQVAAGTYIEVKVPHGRQSEYVSALVPDAIKLSLHDKVEIAPASCKDGLVPVVRQILSDVSRRERAAKGP